MDTNKKPIYPFEPWNVSEDHLDLAMNYRNRNDLCAFQRLYRHPRHS